MVALPRVVILFFICFSAPIVAQTAKLSVSGKITDANGEPVGFANIFIEELNVGTTTDRQGNYILKNVPKGTYIVAVRVIGFQNAQRTITLDTLSLTNINFSLKEKVEDLKEVVVTGETEKTKLERTAEAVRVIETTEAKIKTADLGQILASTEGVNVRRTGGLGATTQFSLNGLQGEQVRFFLDGIPMDFMGGVNGLANIPVNIIDKVEIYKGVVPIRFGADALGGAVNLTTNQNESALGNTGSLSYQIGSFNTHRVAGDYTFRPKNSKFYVSAIGFYDFTNNNYEIDETVADDNFQSVPVTVERFHDDYRAFGGYLKTGFQNLRWADDISIRGFFTDFHREIQNDAFQRAVYGEPELDRQVYGGLLGWKKVFNKKLDVDFSLGYSYDITFFRDLSTNRYNWLGEITRDDAPPGEIDDPTDTEIFDDNYLARLNAAYSFGNGHGISLTVAPTFIVRSGENLLLSGTNVVDILQERRELLNFINGIQYKWNSLDSRIELLAFGKSYATNLQANVPNFDNFIIRRDVNENYWGYGAGIRWEISDKWAAKSSYEYATRLPSADELFGDGGLVRPNVELNPERSHNINLELAYRDNSDGVGSLRASVNGFYRDTEDLIILLGFTQFFTNRNILNARSVGAELTGSWISRNNQWQFTANGTFQDFRNTSTGGNFDRFEGDRIPNQPYLFGNLSIRYRFDTVFGKNTIDVFAGARYVNEFFRNWESVMAANAITIPSQFTQNVGATYNFKIAKNMSSITLEAQNLTDQDVFDLFGVQLPGRAIFLKWNTRI
ncbi:MAG: TonB-dependent receptor [Bacteroidota bacterium]